MSNDCFNYRKKKCSSIRDLQPARNYNSAPRQEPRLQSVEVGDA